MSGRFLEEIMTPSVAEAKPSPECQEPHKYKVILLNDDYTPMDFVVHVLQYFFHMSEAVAVEVMLQVHHQGRGMCGIYPHDIAQTLVGLVNDYARSNQHPLLCCMEQA